MLAASRGTPGSSNARHTSVMLTISDQVPEMAVHHDLGRVRDVVVVLMMVRRVVGS
jgi:hypothetical protein